MKINRIPFLYISWQIFWLHVAFLVSKQSNSKTIFFSQPLAIANNITYRQHFEQLLHDQCNMKGSKRAICRYWDNLLLKLQASLHSFSEYHFLIVKYFCLHSTVPYPTSWKAFYSVPCCNSLNLWKRKIHLCFVFVFFFWYAEQPANSCLYMQLFLQT